MTLVATPSRRDTELRDPAAPLLAVLRSTAITDHPRLRKSIVDAVCDHDLRLAPMLIGVVEAASTLSLPQLDEIALTQIGRFCTRTLEAELAQPPRADDDWSITELEAGGCCDDCARLAGFLTDPATRQLTWPLTKPRRQHIHHRIDEAELPVTHQTKRQGSPHKLILTKTAELFNRDAKRRKAAQASLGTVQRLLGTVER